MIMPKKEDIDALWQYQGGTAQSYHGMSYADGIEAVLLWLEGNAPRPDLEEE